MNARSLPHAHMNPLFEGVAEATEEAILNALCAAESMTGHKGRVAAALPTDRLVEMMRAGRL
jgi:D-aminopeptidase